MNKERMIHSYFHLHAIVTYYLLILVLSFPNVSQCTFDTVKFILSVAPSTAVTTGIVCVTQANSAHCGHRAYWTQSTASHKPSHKISIKYEFFVVHTSLIADLKFQISALNLLLLAQNSTWNISFFRRQLFYASRISFCIFYSRVSNNRPSRDKHMLRNIPMWKWRRQCLRLATRTSILVS